MYSRYTPAAVRDALSFDGNPGPIRHAMMRVVSANQDERPHVQLLAAAAALVVMAESIGSDPVDIIQRVRRMKRDIDGPFSKQWQGLEAYARGELLS